MYDFYEVAFLLSLIVQRFRVNCRMRGSEKAITAYTATLQELALHCKYTNSKRCYCHKLLVETELTTNIAFALVQADEVSECDAQTLQSGLSAEQQVGYTTFEPPSATTSQSAPSVSCKQPSANEDELSTVPVLRTV